MSTPNHRLGVWYDDDELKLQCIMVTTYNLLWLKCFFICFRKKTQKNCCNKNLICLQETWRAGIWTVQFQGLSNGWTDSYPSKIASRTLQGESVLATDNRRIEGPKTKHEKVIFVSRCDEMRRNYNPWHVIQYVQLSITTQAFNYCCCLEFFRLLSVRESLGLAASRDRPMTLVKMELFLI